MKNNPVTKCFEPVEIDDHNYHNYGHKFLVEDLIRKSKEYEVFDLDLNSIDLSAKPWEFTDRVADLAYHFLRVQNADLSYPIILDEYGYICDGWHRLMKALITNQKTIKAIRLLAMPKGEKVKSDE